MATIIPTTCTEQQAMVYSEQYPDLIFYTTDTQKVIKGGDYFGKDDVTSPIVRSNGSIGLSLTALVGEMFDNTLDEASAITASASDTDVIYLATDTKAIIKGGVIYGGSIDVAKPFKFASDLTDQSNWNTDYIYVVPSSGNVLLYAYISGAWANVGSQTMTIATDASDINYDLTNTPDLGDGDVQSAIESEDAKLEQLSIEVLGERTDGSTDEYWEDQMYDKMGWTQNNTGGLWSNGSSSLYFQTTAGSVVFRMQVEGGETFRLEGMGNRTGSGSNNYTRCWAVCSEFSTATTNNTNWSSIVIPSATDPSYTSGRNGVNAEITLPSNAKMLLVSVNSSHTSELRIYKKVSKPAISIADKTGRKIDNWQEDCWCGGAIGSKIELSRQPTFGIRLACVKVNEGDKLLLDLASYTDVSGIFFTDENRIVVERPDAYKSHIRCGIYTAPCDGYAYLTDSLYRDNYIFDAAHGALAEAALNNRRKDKLVYPNEFCIKRFTPITVSGECTAESVTTNVLFGGKSFTGYIVSPNGVPFQRGHYEFAYIAIHITVGENHTAGGVLSGNLDDATTTAFLRYSTANSAVNSSVTFTSLNDIAGNPDGIWRSGIVLKGGQIYTTMAFQPRITVSGMTVGETMDYTIDYIYLTREFRTFVDAEDFIVNTGRFFKIKPDSNHDVCLDKIYDTYSLGKITDMQLGYNILDMGATLPLNEQGYKDAVTMHQTTPTIAGGSWYRKYHDRTDIKYFPMMTLTSAVTSLQECFVGCSQIRSFPKLDMKAPNGVNAGSIFNGWARIKEIVMPDNCPFTGMGNTNNNNYSLKRVTNLDTSKYAGAYHSWGANNHSLSHVEELDMSSYTYDGWSNSYTFWGSYNDAAFKLSLRYILYKNLGAKPQNTHLWCRAIPYWGIPTDEEPDARKSLVDSLLTYSFDRAGANETARQEFIADALGTALGLYEPDALPATAEEGDLALVKDSPDIMSWNSSSDEWVLFRTAETDDKYATPNSAYTWSGEVWTQWTKPYATFTIHLRTDSYNALTTDEKAAIIAKGFAITSQSS